MGRVIVFGVGGLIVIGLIVLAIIFIGGVAPKIASFFWRSKKKTTHQGETKNEIEQDEPDNYRSTRWRNPDDWRDRV